MNLKYIHIYNNLINYTRNKDLYKNLNREDNFSDRLTIFLLHFSFLGWVAGASYRQARSYIVVILWF